MLGVSDEERPVFGVYESHVGYRAVREHDRKVETQVVGESLEFDATEFVGSTHAGGERGQRRQGYRPGHEGASGLKSAMKLSRVTEWEAASPSRSSDIRCLSNRRSYSFTSKVS